MKIGDLVILQVDNSPRSHWPLGRITDVYPGRDNVVRTVKVKTPSNELIRSSRRLCLLQANDQ